MDRAMGTREARAVFRGLGRTRCAARTRVVCERMWDVDCLLQIRVIGSAFGSIAMAIAVEGKERGEEVDNPRLIGKNSNWGRVERV